jgi:cytochrome c oxidase assembly protein subunit 15
VHGHSVSPAAYRRVTFLALVALGVIVVTGAAVRLTGSGLGCPEWPNCDVGHLSPHGDTGYHGAVEFVNRAFTGLVSIFVMLAVLGSLVRAPRRRDLTWLSLGLVAGVLAQIVLGGLTVKYGLSPPWVMAHFLVSMLLVADAVVLHHRAGLPDGVPVLPVVSGAVSWMGRGLIVVAAIVLAAGTVVTGTGPHGGDRDVRRLDLPTTDVARVHGILVMIFIATVLVTIWMLGRDGAPPNAHRKAGVLLGVIAAQAIVGYVQYFAGVPILLVALHVFGAVTVWVATLQFVIGLRAPVSVTTYRHDLVELER